MVGLPADDAAYLLCAEDAYGAFQLEPTTSTAAAGISVDAVDALQSLASSGDGEFIAEFIGGESEHSRRHDYPVGQPVDSAARAESVAWILNVRRHYGFLPLKAYLAVSYMDRFISLRHPPGKGWAMQLLAVTCISLAAKMEETLVPSFLDLQIEGTRYIFEARTICRMELLVLNALDWRLRSITPFTFLHFFAYKGNLNPKQTSNLIDRATQVTLATMHDIEFLNHCPSSIAAAAVLCAWNETVSFASIDPAAVASRCIGLDEGAISSCYQLMQQLIVSNVQSESIMAMATSSSTVGSEKLVSSNSSSSPRPSKRRKRSSPGT